MDLPPSTCKEPGKAYHNYRGTMLWTKKPCKTKKGWSNRLKRWMQRRAECASLRWYREEFGGTPQ